MISYTTGNILDADKQALVNTVNTVGVMGKGIALGFKKTFPIVHEQYQKAISNNEIEIGKVQLIKTNLITPEFVINFPTKKHWKQPSKLLFIEEGLKDLVHVILENNLESIAIPPLGCGNGRLSWHQVKPLIELYLAPLSKNVDIQIYEPGYNDQVNRTKTKDASLTPARAMVLHLMNEYQILGYSINLLVVQKIAYFLQRFGENLNLNYEKGYYGPYAHRLMHLLKYLNGSFLQYSEEKNIPDTKVRIIEKKMPDVIAYYNDHISDDQKKRVHSVLNLIEGFESPYGLELLATVDFIVNQTNKNSDDEIQNEIANWTTRKSQIMKPYHIKVAMQRLIESGLIPC